MRVWSVRNPDTKSKEEREGHERGHIVAWGSTHADAYPYNVSPLVGAEERRTPIPCADYDDAPSDPSALRTRIWD